MSKIDEHNEAIGRILSFLVNQGLHRVDLQTGDAKKILSPPEGAESEAEKTFTDALHWMLDEGLIRAAKRSETMSGRLFLPKVQLTSTGIAVVQAETNDPELGESIEKKVAEAEGGLEPATYTKIGSFVGGLLAGFTKTIS